MAWDGPKWGQEDFFPTNPDLADILGRTDSDFENFPKQSLRCRVLVVLVKGPWVVRGSWEFNFNQKKSVLGDTCSRLAYAKQSVASSNINIYNRKSTLFTSDRS